jgi:membrane-bound lytic murein transglycosylase D
MMKKLLFVLLIAATASVETSKAQELMPPEPAPVEDLRGYDWHFLSQKLGNSWSSLTDTQIMYRVSRAYLLQSRIIQAQAVGDKRSLEHYMDQAMDELAVLSDQPGFVSQPQFRELYRTIVHEHEEYYGADLDEIPEYRSILARRSAMFGTRAPREITKDEISVLSEITPAATTEYTARVHIVNRTGATQEPVIPRGYDRYALSRDCGNPRGSLTEDQITCRVSRAYRLQSRTIRAQADGDQYSAERYMNQVMDELVVLSKQSGFVSQPQFRELYRTIVYEHETGPDTGLNEPQEYGEIYALRDAMFEAQSRMKVPTAAATSLPRIKPVATTIPMTRNKLVEDRVAWWLEVERRDDVIRWLGRADVYFPMIEQIFAEEGVPDELKYLAGVESGLRPRIQSPAKAVGMWQFIASTGRAMGLRIDEYVDERMDPVKATRAAARHLKQLYGYYGGDWQVALSGYNCSPKCVLKAISRAGGTRKNPPSYWQIRRHLPGETQGYIPKFISLALIMSNPVEFGLPAVSNGPEFTYDEITVSGMLKLETIARMVGTTTKHIQELNPELRRNILPPDRTPYTLRIPPNTFARFADAFEQLPDEEKAMPGEHRVRRGENLGRIARQYGVTVRAIQNANGLGNRTRIHPNDRLVIPGMSGRGVARLEGTSARLVAWGKRANRPIAFDSKMAETVRQTPVKLASNTRTRSAENNSSSNHTAQTQNSSSPGSTRSSITHTVRRGDTLSELATEYGTTVSAIQQANGLRGTRIGRGQRLKIPTGRITHTVKRGENLGMLANRYSTTVQNIRNANNLHSNTIYPGQKLLIGGTSAQATTHTVRRGENLGLIAKRYGTTVRHIMNANNLRSSRIYPGQKLSIGGEGADARIVHTVKRGENLTRIAQRYGTTVRSIRNINNLRSSRIYPGQRLSIDP